MTLAEAPSTIQKFVVDQENPWPGLSSFTEEMGSYFHGRDLEKEELFRMVKRSPLSTLFGQSGMGKTSLIYAGLFPLLRQANCLPVNIRLDFGQDSPPLVQQVRLRLVDAARASKVECPDFPSDSSLWEFLHRSDVEFWSSNNRLLTPVFILDQFEEIFTLASSSRERSQQLDELLQQLSDLVENRYPAPLKKRLEEDPDAILPFEIDKQNFRILMSLREDYLPHLEDLKRQFPTITENRIRLNRMVGTYAIKSILGAGGHLIDTEVAAKVVHFVAAEKRWQTESDEVQDLASLQVEPSLLCVICRELNNRRKILNLGEITAELLTGTREQILEDLYLDTISDIPETAVILVEEDLITVSGFRDSIALENALRMPGITREVIDKLIDRRLLRLEERFGILRIELMHDVLTRVSLKNRERRRNTRYGLYWINAAFALVLIIFLGIFFIGLPAEESEIAFYDAAAHGDENTMRREIEERRSMYSGVSTISGFDQSLAGSQNPKVGTGGAFQKELNSALWIAAKNGNIFSIPALIAAKANIMEAQTDMYSKGTAVDIALLEGQFPAAKLLIEHGGNPSPEKKSVALRFAVMTGDREEVSFLCKGSDLNPNTPANEDPKTNLDPGRQLLILAVKSGDSEMVKLVLNLGADPTLLSSSFNSTPLDWARQNSPELYLILRQATKDKGEPK